MARVILLILLSLLIGGCTSISSSSLFSDPKEHDLDRVLSTDLEGEFLEESGITPEACTFFFPKKDSESCLKDWRSQRNTNLLDYLRTYGSLAARSMVQVGRTEEFFEMTRSQHPGITDEELAHSYDEVFASERMYDCIQEVVSEQNVSPDVCIFLFGELASPEEVRDTMERLEKRIVGTYPLPVSAPRASLVREIQASATRARRSATLAVHAHRQALNNFRH